MNGVLIDSNVLLDLMTIDGVWYDWSAAALSEAGSHSRLIINAIVYGEISVHFDSLQDLDDVVPTDDFVREPIPFEAGFLAGKAFAKYRRRGGTKTSPLPDFLIGAHAVVMGHRLLTRDAKRYQTYFPSLELIAPQ